MKLNSFLFSLLLIFALPVQAHWVKDSVRSETPVFITESFAVASSWSNYPTVLLSYNGTLNWSIMSGCVSTHNSSGFNSICLILRAISTSYGSNNSSHMLCGLVEGVKTISWKQNKTSKSNAQIQLLVKGRNAIDFVSKNGTYDPSTLTMSYTFANLDDRELKICCYANLNPVSTDLFFIDDIVIETYPWVYSQHEEWDYTRKITSSNYFTICLPKAVQASDLHGVEAYRVLNRNSQNTQLNLEEVETLQAGVPYILVPKAGADSLKIDYTGEAVTTASQENGLIGSLEGISGTTLEGKYILYQGAWTLCGPDCSISANRAYLNLNDVPVEGVSAPTPGRKTIPMNINAPSAVYDVQAIPTPAKQLQKGQIIIRKDNQSFTLTGQSL